MVMEETINTLRSWLVPEAVIQNFIDNDVTIDKFTELTDMYLRELCPHIGQRISLKTHIQDLLDSVASTISATESAGVVSDSSKETSNSCSEEQNESLPILGDISNFFEELTPSLPDFDINTLLQTSAHGNSVLNYYKQYKTLSTKKRNVLVDIVVKHLYTYIVNNKLKPENYNLISAKIITLFPTESAGTYYMKAVPTSKSSSGKYIPAKGKLVDKVRNLLYISGERRRKTSSGTTPEEEGDHTLIDTALDDDILWLQTQSEPWDQVVQKWEKTYQQRVRLNNCTTGTVDEVLQKWAVLKNPNGHFLINLDFDVMYKDKSLNFFKVWQAFFEKLLLKKKDELKNGTGLLLLELLYSITDDDKKIPVQMTLLGYLIPPKGRLSRTIKYSSTEAIASLIVQTDSAGDIDQVIEKRKTECARRKQPVQPYVIVLGKLHDFCALYIVIDDIKYTFNSAATAFDKLFKIYHVLHVKYPQAAEYLYLLIQIKVYDIRTHYDKIPPNIIDILNL